jgi:hypothetical protein
MTRPPSRSLALAAPFIRFLFVLNGLYAAAIAFLLGWSFFIPGWPANPIGVEVAATHPWVGDALRMVVVIGIVGAAIVHTILRRLLAIVDTVRAGDPFIVANAVRLESIAWRVVSLEGLRLLVGVIVRLSGKPFEPDAFSFTPWLAVLLLFVLAGVFRHGARMRADLEGTV